MEFYSCIICLGISETKGNKSKSRSTYCNTQNSFLKNADRLAFFFFTRWKGNTSLLKGGLACLVHLVTTCVAFLSRPPGETIQVNRTLSMHYSDALKSCLLRYGTSIIGGCFEQVPIRREVFLKMLI